MHRRSWMPVAEISYSSHMRQNFRVHGCGKRASRMMGTPCFLLEQAPISVGEFVPHKIQDLGAPGSGVTEEENTLFGSWREAVRECAVCQLQPRRSAGQAQREPG